MVNLGRKYGTHDSDEWIAEGDGLLSSARSMRVQWWQLRRKTRDRTSQGSSAFHNLVFRNWNSLIGMPRASMLLLGYAAEMYLKSGLIKIYSGCDEGLIDGEVKRFGHKFENIAKEISFPMTPDVEAKLLMLKRCVLVDARYPVEIPAVLGKDMNVEYANSVNRRTGIMWNTKTFRTLLSLVKSIRAYVQRLDGDEWSPASIRRLDLFPGGYLVLRYGGNLQARITYRPEDNRKVKRTIGDVKKLAEESWIEARHYWSQFVVVEVGEKGTKKMEIP